MKKDSRAALVAVRHEIVGMKHCRRRVNIELTLFYDRIFEHTIHYIERALDISHCVVVEVLHMKVGNKKSPIVVVDPSSTSLKPPFPVLGQITRTSQPASPITLPPCSCAYYIESQDARCV